MAAAFATHATALWIWQGFDAQTADGGVCGCEFDAGAFIFPGSTAEANRLTIHLIWCALGGSHLEGFEYRPAIGMLNGEFTQPGEVLGGWDDVCGGLQHFNGLIAQDVEALNQGFGAHDALWSVGIVVAVVLGATDVGVVNAPLLDIVKEGGQRVEVLLGNRIEFVVVALGAAGGLTQKGRTHRTHPVGGVFLEVFPGLRTALAGY